MPPSFCLRNLDLFETEYHINTRMHSSRMRTARSLLYQGVSRGVSVQGSLCPGGSLSRGVSVRKTPWKEHGTRGRDPQEKHGTRDRGPQKKHVTRDRDPPRRNMGPGNQTGSDIIQRPLPLLTE